MFKRVCVLHVYVDEVGISHAQASIKRRQRAAGETLDHPVQAKKLQSFFKKKIFIFARSFCLNQIGSVGKTKGEFWRILVLPTVSSLPWERRKEKGRGRRMTRRGKGRIWEFLGKAPSPSHYPGQLFFKLPAPLCLLRRRREAFLPKKSRRK